MIKLPAPPGGMGRQAHTQILETLPHYFAQSGLRMNLQKIQLRTGAEVLNARTAGASHAMGQSYAEAKPRVIRGVFGTGQAEWV